MKRITLFAVFPLIFLMSVIAHLPAQWLLNYLTLPNALQWQSVSGTLWQGKMDGVQWQNQAIGRVQWQWLWSGLWKAEPQVAWRVLRDQHSPFEGKGIVAYSFSGLMVKNAWLSAPASLIAQQMAQLSRTQYPVQVKGQVMLTVDQWQYGFPWCKQAQAHLSWQNAELSSVIGEIALDELSSDIHCQAQEIQLNGQQANTQTSGELSLQLIAPNRYQLDAWFKPEAEFPKPLAHYLSYLPSPDPQGRYHFSQQGQW